MSSKSWIRAIFNKVFSRNTQPEKKKTARIQLLPLEDRLVPAVPFSPAFPHALSITAGGGTVSNSASFTVTFNQPVIGVDAADFQLVNTGTVANGTISSVTGSGATYTVNVTGITGSGTLGVNLVGQPSITALPSFAAQTPVPTGNDPRSVTLGDVNRDGILDIVTASASNSPNVSVCIGVGNGTFQTNVDYPTGNNPFSVTLGDVNGDGILDIITANAGSSDASVLIGNGDGSFKGKVDFPTGNNTSPKSVALGDVNGDGKLDIVTANGTVSSASVLLNTTTAGATTASFSSPTPFATGNATFPSSVTLGDVNVDGKLDIVTTNRGSNSASVLLGNGDGSFKSENSFSTGNDPYSGTLGDVNGDGRLDIISGDLTSYTASVLLNTTTAGATTASFSSPTPFATGNGPRFVTLGDVNGDGRLDIVTANQPANTNSVLLGNGDGTFRPKTDFAAGNIPFSVTLGDVNRDGRLDIITANNSSANASVLLGTGGSAITATFSPQQTFATGTGSISVTLGDVNDDGKLDIITANRVDNTTSVLLGSGNGTFGPKTDFATGTEPFSVTLGDVNGDGRLDIVTANITSNTASVLLNTTVSGTTIPSFSTQSPFSTGTKPYSVTLGDVNGDGKLDIITANRVDNTTSVLLGSGNGTFGPKTDFATGNQPLSVTLGDVNGDGKLDIITANHSANTTSVLLGSGNGTFGPNTDFATGAVPKYVTLGDVNGDGKLDIITANQNANTTSVLLGSGNGSFGNNTDFATGTNPVSVTLGDVNGDGRLDIVTVNFTSNDSSVLLGNGNGTFQTQQTFATGIGPSSVTLGDVNGDGRLDILAANYVNNNASVLLNSLAFTGQTYTVVTSTPTTTVLSSSTNPSVFGQSVTFTATVTGSSGTPTGTVTFKNGANTLGTGTLNGSGIATFSTSALAVGGPYSITAVYGGDSSNLTSTSSATSQVVNQAGTTTTLSASPNPSVLGQSVTFTVTVAPVSPGSGTPTGSVSFFDGATLLGTGTLSSGSASFSTSSLSVASHSITAVYAGDSSFTGSTSSATTQVVNAFGAATQAVLTTAPAGSASGSAFTTQPVVTIRDAFGNTVTNSTAAVTMAVSGNGTTVGTATVNAVNGVATFTNVGISGAAGTQYTLTFASTGLTSGNQSITPTFGTSTQAVLTTAPAGSASGLAFTTQPVVTIQDAFGNTVTNSTAAVTMTVSGNGTTVGTATVNAVNGVATFTNVGISGTAGTQYSLTFASASLTSSTQNITPTFGAATQAVLTTAPAGSASGLAFTTQPVVTIQDAFGNTVTNSTAAVTMTVSGNGTTVGTATVNAVNGVATFTNVGISGTAGTQYTLTFASTGLTSGTQSITPTFGTATQLAITTPASGAVNNLPFNVQPVIAIQDAFGNTVANSSAVVTISSNNGSTIVGSSSATAVNGVATFSGTGMKGLPLTPYTLTYASSSLVQTSQGITITNAPAPLITGSVPPTGNDPSNPGNSVNLYDAQTGQPNGVAVPFPGFMGQIRVAAGDFNNDGRSEIVAGAGPGGGPAVTILDSQTGAPRASFFAYDQSFSGGIYVAVKDINNDGIADIITGAGSGGGPHVKVFNGVNLQEMRSFFAYTENFTGGVSVATADINGDNILDIVTGAGPGGGPHVKVFDGATNNLISSWFAYPVDFKGGVFVGVGDISNDGNFEVVTGAGIGGGPVVAVWNPFTGALLSEFYAYDESFTGGVRVGVSDATGDGILDLVTGAGPGGGPHVKAFDYPNLNLLFEFFSGPETDTQGVFVS